jgi:hypothetical protein
MCQTHLYSIPKKDYIANKHGNNLEDLLGLKIKRFSHYFFLLFFIISAQVFATTNLAPVFAASNLSFYVKNWNGNLVTDGKATVIRYSSTWNLLDQVETDSQGKATWANIPSDTYNFETYYNAAGGKEYWGDVSITLSLGVVSYTFTRFMPFCSSVWIGDTNGASRTSFNAGETVRVKFTVKNDCYFALSCKVSGILDKDETQPWDFDQTTGFSSVGGSGANQVLTLDYVIPAGTSTGTMRLAYYIWTKLLNGNTIVTDSWIWTTFTVSITGTSSLTKSFVALQFDVESDSPDVASGFMSQSQLSTMQKVGNLLQSNDLVGTFYVQGACFDNSDSGAQFAAGIDALMQRNEIEAHFYSHLEDMGTKTSNVVSKELEDTENAAGMKFYGARVPFFDVSDTILSQLASKGYIYSSNVWANEDNTPYVLGSVSNRLYELPWRCSDHDTQYGAIKGVLDNFVSKKSNITLVFHIQNIASDWAGFSQLIQAVANYKSNNKIIVATSLQIINYISHVSQPDLAVNPADIKATPQSISSGNSVSIRAVIHNIGGSNAKNFLVNFYDVNPSQGGKSIGNPIHVGTLEAGLSVPVSVTWGAATGTHQIYTIVDAANVVTEKDETNNAAFKNMVITFPSTPSPSPTPPPPSPSPSPTPTPTKPSANRFSPTTDGYNFNNDIPKKAASYWDALNALNSASWANSIPAEVRPLFALFSVGVNQMQLGNCFGMSYTAKYYFEHPSEFKSKNPGFSNMFSVDKASASPEILVNQFPGQETMQPYMFNLAETYLGLKPLNYEIQWITHEIDNNHVVQVYLTKRGIDPLFFHSVLVYDYDSLGSEITLKIYDPNHSAETRFISLKKDQGGNFILIRTGTSGDLVSEYDITNIGAGESTSVNWSSLSNRMTELVQIAWNLMPKTGLSFLGIKVASPVNILVKAPDGTRAGYDPTTGKVLYEIPGVYYSGPSTEPQVAIIPDPNDNPYDITLSGTGNGAYTLTAERYTHGQLVGNPVYANGNIENGASKEYSLQLVGSSIPSISEVQKAVDYTPYMILGAAIVVAGIIIGIGLNRRK